MKTLKLLAVMMVLGLTTQAQNLPIQNTTEIKKVCLDGKVWYMTYVNSGSYGSTNLIPKLVYTNYENNARPTKISQADCK